jgi:pimeloyl-ACP methyl ester carboxylesterase
MISSRRGFLRSTGALLTAPLLRAQNAMSTIDTPTLKIAYHESGNRQGFPVILLHGFPDDAHAYDDVASALAQAGHRILVPYLRGCGETRFRDASAPRMAEQAAIAQDLVDFADALGLARFALAGYDWGGRAAQVTAALHPERVRAAVFCGGYLIQNTIDKAPPAPPAVEKELWYQYYFNPERGRAGLAANRRAICKYLWQTWAPDWKFTDETYNPYRALF